MRSGLDTVLSQSDRCVANRRSSPRIDTLSNKIQHPNFTHAGDLLRRQYPNLVVSKRRLRQVEAIQMVRENREADKQNLGFCARPFVLCGLPVRRPRPAVSLA